MKPKFVLARETEYATPDWGRVGGLSTPSTTGAKHLTVLEGRLHSGKGHSFHKHKMQEEMIIVVSGKIEQWLEQEKRVLGAGDSVFIPPNTVHASFNVGEAEAHIIAIFGPSVGDAGLEMIDMSSEAPWNGLRG